MKAKLLLSFMRRKVVRARRYLESIMFTICLIPGFSMAAGLPEMEAPSTGADGFLSTIKGYLYDYGGLAGLVLCLVALLVVANAAIGSFNEARKRGEWGNFAVIIIVGICLIVAVIWLATMAAPILA